jgi:NodT family efflux transporter outer membrane factor (OMF) lipoprotein
MYNALSICAREDLNMLRKSGLCALATLALTACTVGPDYVRPAIEAPAAFKEAGEWKAAQPRDYLARDKWWDIFGDPQLNALEELVDISNQNVRVAEAQFRQAEALVRAAGAGYFPVVSGNLSATRGRSGLTNQNSFASGRAASDYSLSLGASWEADLWGRVRRLVESGKASAQASAADLESARLSAQAALAQDYFLLRIADAQRRLLDDTVAAYQKSMEMTKNRYVVGVADKLDVVQAETQLKATQAQAIDIGVQRAKLEHAIAVLVGKAPSTFAIEPTTPSATLPSIPVGVPSELLERRPDIAGAERRVAAANAQIGVAKSAFFPALTLSAAGGFESGGLAKWLTLPNRFWSVGPALAETLFDGGLRRAQSDQAVAAYDASVATYRQTVLGGFQEVEDNLAALRLLEQEAQVQDEAVKAARQSVILTTNQYKAGTVSYLNVVIVQATALANERTSVDLLGRRLAARVLLIEAIGGGWNALALPSPTD